MSEPFSPVSVRFGDFELVPHLRRLERNGAPVELSSRATDILCLLAERPGQVVTKRELLERVWPDTAVDEGSIRFHVAALRRALGDGEAGVRLIATVPGRGYCFVGSDERPALQPLHAPSPHGLPSPPSRVVGREGVVEDLADRLARQHFVTLVGAGGIGKTTVALMAAHHWADAHRDPVTFVDLGAVTPDALDAVADVVAAALGLSGQPGDRVERVVDHLRRQRRLLVLDTCEATIDGAARLAESVFAAAPDVRLLATSREALRVEGEWVYRIEALAQPGPDAGLSAADALRFPAVQLFVQRATASQAGFELRDEDAPIVGAICRDLGGLALAIELAAGRVEAYGVLQIAELLSTEFALIWPGRRTAAPRLQTLNATLNWSYELLSAAEQTVFRRLGVFAGAFSLEGGLAVAAGEDLEDPVASEALSSLVGKSLLSTENDGDRSRYRMLDTTRAYARTRWAANEETSARLRHAQHYLHRLAEIADGAFSAAEAAELTGNVRAALEWGFGEGGGDDVTVQLAARAAGLWLQQGLFVDARRWSRLALARLDTASPSSAIDARLALTGALINTDGLAPETRRRWEKDYAAAKFTGDLEQQLTGLFGLWLHHIRSAHYRDAQATIDSADVLRAPVSDPSLQYFDDWMRGSTAHHLGDQPRARVHLERLLNDYPKSTGRPVLLRFGYDLEIVGLRTLSLTLFLLGAFGEANATSRRGTAKAKAQQLSYAVPSSSVAIWRAFLLYFLEEDDPEIDSLTRSMIEEGHGAAMHSGVASALCFRGLWLARRGDLDRGAELVHQGLIIFEGAQHAVLRAFVHAELALQTVRHGGVAATAIDTTSELFAEPDPETWCTAEILRIRGELAERQGRTALAEDYFRQGFDMAERQGAVTWALRNAIGLAGLWLAHGRAGEAVEILAPILGRFRPDERQPDVRRAQALLETCRRARVSV